MFSSSIFLDSGVRRNDYFSFNQRGGFGMMLISRVWRRILPAILLVGAGLAGAEPALGLDVALDRQRDHRAVL